MGGHLTMGAGTRHNGGPPNSWGYLAMGFVTLSVAAVLAGLMLARYLNDRPVDLTPATGDLIRKFASILETNGIPLENVAIAPGARQVTNTAVWRHYDVTVDVPTATSRDGLAQIVKRDFTGRGVIVTGMETDGRLEQMRLSLGGQVFATVQLTGGFTAKTSQTDITPACERLANDVTRALRLHLPEGANLRRGRPVHQEASGVRWMTTPIEVASEGLTGPTAVRDLVAERLQEQDVTISLHDDGGIYATVVTYLGYDAVRITSALSGVAEESEAPKELVPVDEGETRLGEELPDLDSPDPAGAMVPLDSEGLGAAMFEPLTLDGPVTAPSRPQVAIIVDDGGNNRAVDEGFLELDSRLTLAILPFTPHAAHIAREGAARGFEIMLHMPMESDSPTVKHAGMITTTMEAAAITEHTAAALAAVPGIVGVNNHTGSKFTEDEAGMRSVMALLKERGLYFIDSRTSAQSVAPAMAREAGVPVAVRDVFLDNEADTGYIAQQFAMLIDKAKERGYAIGICHFRPVTLEAMRTLVPQLKSEGIELVHASAFVS